MTLTATTNRVQYNGDDATTSFAITFVFWDNDDPQVVHTDANGVETTWVRGTQYTITGGSGATGTLTIVTSPTDYTPATGEKLTIKSNLANTQPTDLPSGGDLSSGSLEQQLDQIVRQLQQFSETVGRSITLKLSSTESGVTINDLSGNTGKFPQVNAAEDGFTFASVTSSGTITDPVPIANGGTGSTTAATALTALAAAGTGVSNTFTKNQVWTKGSDIASASPLVLGSTGNYYDVTGSTGFSQITCTAGTLFILQFDGALTMTDGANLDLAGSNITTAAGDRALFFAVAANTAQLLSYQTEGGGITPVSQAAQAAIEAETNENTYIPPDLIKHSPGVAKAWCEFDGTAVDGVADLTGVNVSYNITSVVDNSAGDHTINFTTAFSTANYSYASAVIQKIASVSVYSGQHTSVARTASAFRCQTSQGNTSTATDETSVSFTFFGDQ